MSTPGRAFTLTRIGNTALYAPAGGETWVFLLWDTAQAPASLPLAETWADQGPPQRPGWYVFLCRVPSGAKEAPALEAGLRQKLPAPVGTGFVWSGDVADSGVDLRGTIAVALDPGKGPVTADNTPLILPDGMLAFGFAKALRVASTCSDEGGMDGLVLALPDRPSEPWLGVRVPLAGPLAGCILFGALLESAVMTDRSVKRAADVRLDPLRPFDPVRTRTTPTGAHYVLVASGGGAYRLEPYPSS